MRRCVFAGPSLHGVADRPSGIVFRGPAGHGDLFAAVEDGFEWIGLIDGVFGSCAAVWHKEILYALAAGRAVSGAASMGALRAAECHRFGMRPVGSIAWDYVEGQMDDDADVALLHGPAELDYLPFTEPLVDARATIANLASLKLISPGEERLLLAAAQALHFTQRTVGAMVGRAVDDQGRQRHLATLYDHHAARRKRADALLLVQQMAANELSPTALPDWTLADTASLARLKRSRSAA